MIRFAVLVFSIFFLACEPMPITKAEAEFIRDQTDEVVEALHACMSLVRNVSRTALGPSNESARWAARSQTHWGQSKHIPDQNDTNFRWERDRLIPLMAVDPPNVWRVPRQQSLVLGANIKYDPAAVVLFRWQLQFGVGGALSTVTIDASELQQICMPAEVVRVSFFATADGALFSPGGTQADIYAYLGDGTNVTDPPTLTQVFNVSAGFTTLFDIPAGATGFRIIGLAGSLADPFAATATYGLVNAAGTVIDNYNGLTDMLIIHRAGVYVPIPGVAVNLSIQAAVAGVGGYIVWSFEL